MCENTELEKLKEFYRDVREAIYPKEGERYDFLAQRRIIEHESFELSLCSLVHCESGVHEAHRNFLLALIRLLREANHHGVEVKLAEKERRGLPCVRVKIVSPEGKQIIFCKERN